MIFVKYRWLRSLMLYLALIILFIAFFISNNNVSRSILLILIAFTIYQSYIETLVSLAFITPGNRKPEITDNQWSSHYTHGDVKCHYYSRFNENKAPLVIIIHGWRSGASSSLPRANIYINMGYHVVLFEMPSHGKSEWVPKWTAGVAVKGLTSLMKNLTSKEEFNRVSKMYLHGHSMGGFVSLKYSSLAKESKDLPNVSGYILESPMTCYSYIYDEIINKLRVPTLARESLWNRMKKHFNFLNKHIKPIDILADADVPIWGYITSPMLILQAEIDDRLALDHYDKLLESHNKNQSIEAHLISDLTHAGARINTNRDDLIKNWLYKQS